MELPNDPIMLMSVLNTKLRDQYENLDRLCEEMNLDQEEIIKKLRKIGYEYLPECNQFR